MSRLIASVVFLFLVSVSPPSTRAAEPVSPNVVVIFIDDLGYADIGPFGAKGYTTPNLDRMAIEGRKFTNFVVASAVCSASRSALMTGCIHERIGFRGALGPNSKMGIAASETTLAEVCKQKGYATACFGKWHLGHHPKFLPTKHGFDTYLGLPYSNDMWPFHPDFVNLPPDSPARKNNYPPLPLIENDRIVDSDVTGEDQTQLTKLYTERSVKFIRENRDRPFFLYLPHAMVHVPLYVSKGFENKSTSGLFGDVMAEVDWSVGEILKVLKETGIDDRTLVVFTSDNGPWLSYGNHAGSAGPLREGKGTAFEGGVRVPTIMRWPTKIPANTSCNRLASTIDLLPTVAACIDATPPTLAIDGKDIRPLLFGTGDVSPHKSYPYYYANQELRAVRNDRWKLMFAHQSRSLKGSEGGKDGMPTAYKNEAVAQALYDLESDVGETKDVSDQYPEIVAELQKGAEYWRNQLGDSLTKKMGTAIRPADQLETTDRRLSD